MLPSIPPRGILAHLQRMVSWNLNTFRFGGDEIKPNHSPSEVRWARILRASCFPGWVDHLYRLIQDAIAAIATVDGNQKSQGFNHLEWLKPCKEWDKLPTSTGAGFLNRQKYHWNWRTGFALAIPMIAFMVLLFFRLIPMIPSSLAS